MGAAIVAMIPFALGKMIAVNPTIAVILLLVSADGRSKALAYVVGAVLGPLLAGTVLLSLVGSVGSTQPDDGSTLIANGLQVVIGLTFLALAFRSWQQRADNDAGQAEIPELPGWMRMLDRIGVAGALGLGAVMTVVGVKNLLMLTGVVVAISTSGLSFGQQEIVLLAFVLISTIPVATPLVTACYLGPRADDTLNRWKTWLARNSALIVVGLFLFLGTYFLVRGLGGVLGARA